MRKDKTHADGSHYILNPSDFAFLWEECKRCFYLKVRENFRRPATPMAKIFTVIDGEMKKYFDGKRTEKMMPFLPPGIVDGDVSWVQSKPIEVPKHRATCVIRGKIDTLVRFDDNSFGVIDFKTSSRCAEHVQLYGRQLHAYATALEQAAAGHASLSPIRSLGLLVYEPQKFAQVAASAAALTGGMSWIPIERDDKKFFTFLGEILDVLERPEPPRAEACEWCQYREASRRNQF
ncbi:MAG TPA: PD-(D/E)XK nuclease family protein [Candidatus Acidoferrales bacterium]|nr:PD-(D/E)XK nuclease family protein [Candidatus Acidoferrales bacterium]